MAAAIVSRPGYGRGDLSVRRFRDTGVGFAGDSHGLFPNYCATETALVDLGETSEIWT